MYNYVQYKAQGSSFLDVSAPLVPGMAYKQDGYTLHKRDVELKNGGTQTIYFFSKKKPKSGVPCDLPDGYQVGVNKQTGLPYLKKK